MNKMTEFQYKLVKFFLTEIKTPPKVLWKTWRKFGTRIELEEIYRVQLTANYEVYKNDQIPGEDVMLVMEGLGK